MASFALNEMTIFRLLILITCVSTIILCLFYQLRKHGIAKYLNYKGYSNSNIFTLFISIYAFFLGFSIVTLWNQIVSARQATTNEAVSLMTTYTAAIPLKSSNAFRNSIIEYINIVISEEWPLMDSQSKMSQKAWDKLDIIWSQFTEVKAHNEDQRNICDIVFNALSQSCEHRIGRNIMLYGNLYPLIWIILIIGFCAILIEMLFQDIGNHIARALFEFFTIFLLISCLYLIYDMGMPFSGLVRVDAHAFREVGAYINQMSK